MTGIVACLAAVSPNVIYGTGLYRLQPSGTVDTSPISVGTQSSFSGAVNLTYEWIGYYRAASTTTVTLGASAPYVEWLYFNGFNFPNSWGGGGNSICYIWTGATARSGYNSGNATVTASDATVDVPFSTVAGTYYPIRIQWSTQLPQFVEDFDEIYYAQSSFDFRINSSTSVSGLIFYNTLTNGF
jgi:hypothetical protein